MAKLLHLDTRRQEGTSGKRQAMDDNSRREEFWRQTVGLSACTRIRKQEVGVLRSQKDDCEHLTGASGDDTEESPYKEELALFRESDSLHRASTMVRRAMKVGKEDHWSELWKSSEFNSWTRAKLQECYHEVRQDDDQRKSIVQQIMWKSTNILRRKIVPGSHCRTCGSRCHHFRAKFTFGWSRRGTRKTVQLVVRGLRRPVPLERSEQSLGRTGQRGLHRGEGVSDPRSGAGCVRQSRVRSQVFGRTNRRERDSLVDVLVEGFQELSKSKIMDEVKRFIKVE